MAPDRTRVRPTLTIAQLLAHAGCQGLPALEGRLLLMQATGLSRPQLLTRDQDTPPSMQQQAFLQLLARRLAGEPIAYLLGQREFFGLPFSVTPDVLIPRPDTELLVELALARCADLDSTAKPQLLDLGTGSGAIAIALAHSLPHAQVTATDASLPALAVAQHNTQQLLGTSARLRFLHGNWYAALPPAQDSGNAGGASLTRFDLIVSNPPYIAVQDPHLQQGDLRFEPLQALTDQADGLTHLRQIVSGAPTWLQSRGWLLMEHGYDQATTVRQLLRERGFTAIFSARDLAGIERVTGGQWPIAQPDTGVA